MVCLNRVFVMRFLGEFTGTMLLVGLGCMGSINTSNFPNSPMQSGLQYGLVIMIITHCFGFVSGAHANPIISLSCFVIGFISAKVTLIYMLAQFLGALFGYLILTIILPEDLVYGSKPGLCMSVPHSSLSVEQAFAVEFFLSMTLIFGWCALWDLRNGQFLDSISLRIGLLMTACTLAGGVLTGAAMNPAKAFAASVFQNNFEHLWIYFISPTLASVFTSFIWIYLYTPRYRIFHIPSEPPKEDSIQPRLQSRSRTSNTIDEAQKRIRIHLNRNYRQKQN